MDTKADTDQLQVAHNKSIIIILYSSMLLAAAAYVHMLGLIKAQSVYLRNQVLPHIDPKLRLDLGWAQDGTALPKARRSCPAMISTCCRACRTFTSSVPDSRREALSDKSVATGHKPS